MANHRKCTICNGPIVLMPSAAQRAQKYGETPQYYINLFKDHPSCAVAKRSAEAIKNMRRYVETGEGSTL